MVPTNVRIFCPIILSQFSLDKIKKVLKYVSDVLIIIVFLGNLQANLVERPPVPGVVLLPGDLERGHDGDAGSGGGFTVLGADGDEAGEGEELSVQEVVVAEGLVAHG